MKICTKYRESKELSSFYKRSKSAFDLTNKQHLILACHYLNLQPLWWEGNRAKWNTIPTFQLAEDVAAGRG